MKNKKLLRISQNENEAIKIIENLKAVGYKDDEISIIEKHKKDLEKIEEATHVDMYAEEYETYLNRAMY